MPDISSLASRIAAFTAVEEKMKKLQSEQVAEHKGRQKRLDQLVAIFDQLRPLWRPRLELLLEKFGNRVQATPRITPSNREVTFDFQSRLARVRLKFSASTDRDVQKVILGYDLEIVPALMRFTPHDELEFPLDAVDPEAAAKWVDDRIVDFVQTYFALSENEIYLREHMVEDPISHVQFPKEAAATFLEWQGRTFYFTGEETRRELEAQKGIAPG